MKFSMVRCTFSQKIKETLRIQEDQPAQKSKHFRMIEWAISKLQLLVETNAPAQVTMIPLCGLRC